MNWSAEQEAIFERFRNRNSGNLTVIARAGTGKTTTIIAGVKQAPEKRIRVMAFNRNIEKELNLRLADVPNAQSKTIHGTGYGIIMRYWEGIQVKFDASKQGALNRADGLAVAVCGGQTPDHIVRLVSKLHTKGREIAPHARRIGDLTELLYRFDCDPDEYWEEQGYDANFVEKKSLEAMELAATVRPPFIDFSDMIFLPCRNRWIRPMVDMVVVDEAQDMTSAQLEIATGISRGRVIVVGDDRQAIYGFRGADSESLSRLRRELNADVLGLKTTYRCGKRIVELAQTYVPDFVAAEGNPDGEILALAKEKLVENAQHGCFILSRTNAPLVSVALSLLKNGKRARVAGRDIGAGLKAIIKKLKARSIPDMLARVQAWEQKQIARIKKALPDDTVKVEQITDKADMLRELIGTCAGVGEVEPKIDALFADDGLGQAGIITCSSVHKAKGLEAEKVYLLEESFRPANGQIEEENIRYVAVTRAKKTLVLVAPPVQS